MFLVKTLKLCENLSANLIAVLNGLYVAIASESDLLIWPIDALNYNPNRLNGHSKIITGLTFGVGSDDESVVLCSSDADQILIWTIGIGGFSDDSKVFKHNFGAHECIKLCPRDSYLAITAQNVVHVLALKCKSKESATITLDAHTSPVIMVEFSYFSIDLLITCSADKTYAAWNYNTGALMYQSSINVFGMYTCVAMDPITDRYAVGTSNGLVSIVHAPNFSEPQVIDVNKNSLRRNHSSESPRQTSEGELISMFFTMKPTMPSSDAYAFQNRPGLVTSGVRIGRKSPTKELLEWPSLLVLGFSTNVVLLHSWTFEKLFHFDFTESLICHFDDPRKKSQVSSAFSFCFMDMEDSLELWCMVNEMTSSFNGVHLLMMSHPFAQNSLLDSENAAESDFAGLSVVATTAPLYTSPLKPKVCRKPTVMAARANMSKAAKGSKTSKTALRNANANKPVTFKEKIKSSGYGTQAPPRKMFTPKTDFKSSSANVAMRSLHNDGSKKPQFSLIDDRKYPSDAEPPVQEKAAIDADSTLKKPITQIRFSPNGKMLVASSANNIAHVFQMPLGGRSSALKGHNGPVKVATWSVDSSRIVTASDDKTVRIWNSTGDRELCLCIDSHGSTQKPEKKFEKEISWSSFYYNDGLVLLTSGYSLYAYSYHIDMSKTSDIKTYDYKCRYSKVHQVDFTDCASITSASAINSFLSHYVFVATSAKNLYIYDMNRCSILRTFDSCQERPVHCIRHNEGSLYSRLDESSVSSESYNIFATSAVCDGIKLWDVRQKLCVRKFDNHYNKFYHCGFDWSPCGKYIASSSEDRCGYLYDVTASAYLHKYTRLSDIGTSVSFHPLYPEVAFSFNDGRIHLFSSRQNKPPDSRKGGMKSATTTNVIRVHNRNRPSEGGSKFRENAVSDVVRGQGSGDRTEVPEYSRSSAVKELL